MTSQQKNILIFLAIADIIFVCCLLPAVGFTATQTADADPLQMAMDSLKGFMPATSTPRPTSTPARTATPVPTPTLEPGWKLYSVPADKFAIALPSSWDSMAFDKANMSAQMDALAKKNPTIANSLKSQSADYLAQLKFVGYETDKSVAATGFMPNINVMHSVETSDLTLDTVIANSQKEFSDAKIAASTRKIKVYAGEMAEFKFTMPMKLNSNQSVNLVAAQYVIIRGRDSYALSCVATDKQTAKYSPICEKIALSFRWVN